MKMDVKLRRFLVFALVVFAVGVCAPATAVAVGDESGNPPVTDTAEPAGGYWTIDDAGALIPADEEEWNVHYDGEGLLVIRDAVPDDALQAIVDELGIVPSDEGGLGLIVFNGDMGVVHGDAILTGDLVVGEGQTLTVPEGAILTIPEGVTLTNEGTLEVRGSATAAGTIAGVGTVVGADHIDTPDPVGVVPTAIEEQPGDVTIAAGGDATASIVASGTGLSYQWQYSTDGGVRWVNLDGATTESCSYSGVTVDMDGYMFRCVVTGEGGSVTSEAATLTVTHDHQLIEVEAKAPTCTDDGNIAYWYCDGCGRYYRDAAGTDEITEEQTVDSATDHVAAATWSSDEHGHWHACENGCGAKLDYAEHAPVVEGEKDATCTKDGYMGDTTCSVCGYAIATGKVARALEHSFTTYVSNDDATCTKDGTETATCDNGCGATDTRTDKGSKLDHKVTTVGAVDPTCTEKGYTGDKVCELCDKVLEKGKAIDASGHEWGEPTWCWSEDGEKFVATFTCERDADHTKVLTAMPKVTVKTKPTCTKTGERLYKGTVKLDGVEYSAKATGTIAATGHDFEDGVCTVCGKKDPDYVKQTKDKEILPATGDMVMAGVIGVALVGALALGAGMLLKRRK